MSVSFQGQLFSRSRWAIASGRSLLLATGASLLCWGGEAAAVETVVLQYGQQERTISTQALSDFAESGAVPPELDDFFQEIGDLPQLLPDILSTEIRISEDFIQDTLGTSLGEFVLLQLDQAINTGSPEENLDLLRSTIAAAVSDDGAISLLELIAEYPAESLQVDLTGLQLAYTRVSNFIEQVEPALRVAREFLQDLICDCEAPATAEAEGAEPAGAMPADALPEENEQSALPAGDRAACARAELLNVIAQLEALEQDAPTTASRAQ